MAPGDGYSGLNLAALFEDGAVGFVERLHTGVRVRGGVNVGM